MPTPLLESRAWAVLSLVSDRETVSGLTTDWVTAWKPWSQHREHPRRGARTSRVGSAAEKFGLGTLGNVFVVQLGSGALQVVWSCLTCTCYW